MAEPKKIITTIEEATCDNCIWSVNSTCLNKEGRFGGIMHKGTHELCNHGLWLFDVPGDEFLSNTYPQTLPSMHSLLRIKARKACFANGTCKANREEENR
jgi:hypothetical protein